MQHRTPGFCKQPKYEFPIGIIRAPAPRSAAGVTGPHINNGTCGEKCSWKGLKKWKPVFYFLSGSHNVSSPDILLLPQAPALLAALLPLLPTAGNQPLAVFCSFFSGCNINSQFGDGEAVTSNSFTGNKSLKMGFTCQNWNSPQVESYLILSNFCLTLDCFSVFYLTHSDAHCLTYTRPCLAYSGAPIFWWIISPKTMTCFCMMSCGVVTPFFLSHSHFKHPPS